MTTTSLIARPLPGPAPTPALGTIGNYMRFLSNPNAYEQMLYERYGLIAGLTKGNRQLVFAFGGEYNRHVWTTPEIFKQASFIPIPVPEESAMKRLDSGLISQNGAQHRQHRQLIQPAFHRQQIEGYRALMVSVIDRMFSPWQVGQVVEMREAMRQLTMLVAASTLFEIEDTTYATQVGRLVDAFMQSVVSPLVMLFRQDLPFSPYRRMARAAVNLENFLLEQIAQKRAGTTGGRDILSTLIRSYDKDGGTLSDKELIGHLGNLFLGSHESSMNVLLAVMLMLTQHPGVYSDLLDELDGVLDGRVPELADLPKLQLLDWVIKESVRLFHPTKFSMRRVSAPTELGGYELPEGATVVLCPYVTNRMAETFAEPARFNPYRWRDLNVSPYDFVMFGGGPHACIGAAFAQMELPLVLATLLQRFVLVTRPHQRVDISAELVFGPAGPLPFMLAARGTPLKRQPMHGSYISLVDLD